MQTTIQTLFGVGPPVPIIVNDVPSPYIPVKDDSYQFREELLRRLLIWHGGIAGGNLLVQGPTGSGKSSLVEQFCNRMGIALYRVPCHARSEFGDFTGQLTVKADGSTEFIHGALPRAMKTGAYLLFDEFNFLPPGVSGALNTVLDGGPLLLPETGELIQPHPDFRIAATGNSVAQGDDAALYRGTQRMNLALIQRFLAAKVDYLSQIEEAKVLHAVAPCLPGSVIQSLVDVADDVRAAFTKGDIETTLSTRVLVKMARVMNARIDRVKLEPLEEAKFALRFTLLDSVKPEDARAIEGTLERRGVSIATPARAPAQPVVKAQSKSNQTESFEFCVTRQSLSSNQPACWGYFIEGNIAKLFNGETTKGGGASMRFPAAKTSVEAKVQLADKIAVRGYTHVGEIEVPSGKKATEYLNEIIVIFLMIIRNIGMSTPSIVRNFHTPKTIQMIQAYADHVNVKIEFI